MAEAKPRATAPEGAAGPPWIRPTRQRRTPRALEASLDAAQRPANERPCDARAEAALARLGARSFDGEDP